MTHDSPLQKRKFLTITFLLLIGLFQVTLTAQTHSVSGYITDATNGETLIGASVLISGQNCKGLKSTENTENSIVIQRDNCKFTIGKTTNSYGYFALTLPEGDYDITVRYMGYKKYYAHIDLNADKKLKIKLDPAENTLDEVVVRADREKVALPQMGVNHLSTLTTNKLPVFFGERDIIKSIQLLPGIKTGGNQTSFSVRGGNVTQNLILLDEATVFNPAHAFGIFSTFNSDAIRDVTVYKGTAPAEFGGRTSSVIDIKMDDGNNEKYGATANLGLISSSLKLEGPIQKGKSSFLIAGRRTYLDMLIHSLPGQLFKDLKLYFYDLNAKFNYSFSDKDRVYLSGYLGRDAFGLDKFGQYTFGNKTGTLRWNHVFKSNAFSNTSLIFTDYNTQLGVKLSNINLQIFNQIYDVNIKQQFQIFSLLDHEIKFGMDGVYRSINGGKLSVNDKQLGSDNLRKGLEVSFFAQDSWKLNDNLRVNYGARVCNYNALGGSKYYQLDENKNLIDTIAPNSIVQSYLSLEPRVTLSYLVNENASLKLGYSRNTQNIHQLVNPNSTSIDPETKWIANTNNIKPEISDILSIGNFWSIQNNYELSAELYYRKMYNEIDYKEHADAYDPIVERQLLSGQGRAYGLELLLKKNTGKLTGWVGYTLSRTERQINGINNNNWYLSDLDRTHDLSVVLMYDINKKLSCSSVWVYRTGRAVTYPSGKYIIDGDPVLAYPERNGSRWPDYKRLDINLTWKALKTKNMDVDVNLGVYNLLGWDNPIIVYFTNTGNETKAMSTSIIRQIPSISATLKLK